MLTTLSAFSCFISPENKSLKIFIFSVAKDALCGVRGGGPRGRPGQAQGWGVVQDPGREQWRWVRINKMRICRIVNKISGEISQEEFINIIKRDHQLLNILEKTWDSEWCHQKSNLLPPPPRLVFCYPSRDLSAMDLWMTEAIPAISQSHLHVFTCYGCTLPLSLPIISFSTIFKNINVKIFTYE